MTDNESFKLEKREKDDLGDKYRALFKSEFGREVLADILYRSHWGTALDAENKQQIGEYNLGVYILARAGILADVNQSMLGIL